MRKGISREKKKERIWHINRKLYRYCFLNFRQRNYVNMLGLKNAKNRHKDSICRFRLKFQKSEILFSLSNVCQTESINFIGLPINWKIFCCSAWMSLFEKRKKTTTFWFFGFGVAVRRVGFVNNMKEIWNNLNFQMINFEMNVSKINVYYFRLI